MKKLQYEQELSLLKDVIYDYYQESNDVVYRNLLSVPSTLKDITPQSKRTPEGTAALIMELTEEDVADMSLKEKRTYIADRSLSVFDSFDSCINDVIYWVNRIKEKYSKEDAECYLKDKRGPYIAEVRLTEEVGLIEKRYNNKGHANLLLYDGVEWESNIIKMHGPFSLNELLKGYQG